MSQPVSRIPSALPARGAVPQRKAGRRSCVFSHVPKTSPDMRYSLDMPDGSVTDAVGGHQRKNRKDGQGRKTARTPPGYARFRPWEALAGGRWKGMYWREGDGAVSGEREPFDGRPFSKKALAPDRQCCFLCCYRRTVIRPPDLTFPQGPWRCASRRPFDVRAARRAMSSCVEGGETVTALRRIVHRGDAVCRFPGAEVPNRPPLCGRIRRKRVAPPGHRGFHRITLSPAT